MSQFGMENVDSEELMSWLLLNPDVDFENFTSILPNSLEYAFPSLQLPAGEALQLVDPSPSLTNDAHVEATHIPTFNQHIVENISFKEEIPYNSSIPHNSSSYSLNSYDGLDSVGGPQGSADSRVSTTNNKKTSSSSRKIASGAASISGTTVASSSGKKRPRESVEDLEARVKELKAENADLQAHLLNVTQRTTEVQKQRISMERLMASKLVEMDNNHENDQSELDRIVKQYTDIYADYGRCRQREVSFHLMQLEKLIVPTLTTKMSLWALQQDRNFFQRNKSPMFDLLCKELEITPEQTEKIQERRERVHQLLGQLTESLELLQSLKVAIENKHASYDKVCGRVQDAANPKQTVKFLMWISKNSEALQKYIPGFNRSVHHTPNVEFVEKIDPVSVLEEQLTTTVGAAINAPLPPIPHNIHRF